MSNMEDVEGEADADLNLVRGIRNYRCLVRM